MCSRRPLVVVLAIVVATAGCRQLVSPADEGVALEIDVEPRPLAVGQTARVTLTLRNAGTEQVMLRRSSAACLITFHLTDQDRQEERPCDDNVGYVALSAQGSWSQTYRWLPRASGDEAPLGPGWYQLVGQVHGEDVSLESEPVTFRIVP